MCEALTEYVIGLIQEWGKTDVSAMFLTDDWGSQDALMISPAMWRRHFKEYYRRIFAEVHRWGKDVMFHSCGNVASIIPDLIEVGVDVLDPLQPGPLEPRGSGAAVSAERWPSAEESTTSGWKTIAPQEVRDMVRRTIDTLGRPYGNSYIVAAANCDSSLGAARKSRRP